VEVWAVNSSRGQLYGTPGWLNGTEWFSPGNRMCCVAIDFSCQTTHTHTGARTLQLATANVSCLPLLGWVSVCMPWVCADWLIGRLLSLILDSTVFDLMTLTQHIYVNVYLCMIVAVLVNELSLSRLSLHFKHVLVLWRLLLRNIHPAIIDSEFVFLHPLFGDKGLNRFSREKVLFTATYA